MRKKGAKRRVEGMWNGDERWTRGGREGGRERDEKGTRTGREGDEEHPGAPIWRSPSPITTFAPRLAMTIRRSVPIKCPRAREVRDRIRKSNFRSTFLLSRASPAVIIRDNR